jgi:hypothetical protein
LRLKTISIAFLACAVLALTAVPATAQWQPRVLACVASATVPGCSTETTAFGDAWNVVVSPDGKNAYAVARNAGAVHVFSRNPATGALIHTSCFVSGTVNPGGCQDGHGIRFPDDIVVAPDGRELYVTSNGGVGVQPAVAVFHRNTTTGALSQSGQLCVANVADDGCVAGRAIGGRGVMLRGSTLYVLGNSTLAALDRQADGSLVQKAGDTGCFGNSGSVTDNCKATTVNPGGFQLDVSGDGKQLYAPSSDGGIMSFARNTATGALTFASCFTGTPTTGCTTVPQFVPAVGAVVLSPDSRHLYASHTEGIVTFARASNGALSFANCINDDGVTGCANSSNVGNLTFMAASPDGQDIVAVPQGEPRGFTAFRRTPTTGALVRGSGLDGCLTPNGRGLDADVPINNACRADARVGLFGHIHFFGNGIILVGFINEGRILEVKRDFYPVCQGRSIAASRPGPTSIPLPCSDRNGDPLTRSIVQPPHGGLLAGINQATGTVLYDPLDRFSGPDAFTFRATAAGLAGPPAAVTLQVPKPKPTKIRGVALAFTFSAFSDHTVLGKLVVKGVPRGGRVRAVCTFHGHRCAGKAGKRFSKRGRGSVSLNRRYAGIDLKVGSTIAIAVTKRGKVGVGKLFTIRARKAPLVRSRCLRPGSNKLRKRC